MIGSETEQAVDQVMRENETNAPKARRIVGVAEELQRQIAEAERQQADEKAPPAVTMNNYFEIVNNEDPSRVARAIRAALDEPSRVARTVAAEVADVERYPRYTMAPDAKEVAIPMLLWCPSCGERHIDVGEFATKLHHTHACQECGMVWRPAIVPTTGVQFLPGFQNEED